VSLSTEKLENLLEPSVLDLGYDLVEVELVKEHQKWILRVYIDKEGGVSLDDCEKVSRHLDHILDEHDPIPQSYVLEVSSPGAERPLSKKKDFVNFVGRKVLVRTYVKINGQKNFKGRLLGLEADQVVLEPVDSEKVMMIPLDKISKANLVLEF